MKVSVIRSVLILSPHLAIATPNEVFDTEYVCRDSLYAHITTLQLLVFSKVSRCVACTSASTVLTTRTSEPHTMTRPLIVCHISFYYPTRQQTRDRSTPQPARVPYSYKFWFNIWRYVSNNTCLSMQDTDSYDSMVPQAFSTLVLALLRPQCWLFSFSSTYFFVQSHFTLLFTLTTHQPNVFLEIL